MHEEYHRWHSAQLGREMEMLVFGHAGEPVLVFPTSMGRYYEYKDFGMIGALADRIANGHLQIYCPDSVDAESWYNRSAHPRQRVLRHMQYEQYIIHEVLPFIRHRAPRGFLIATGCSFGAFQAVNFSFRHPELVNKLVAIAGEYDIHGRLDGYYDEDCYFNCPVDFLPGISDHALLERMRRMETYLVIGEADFCLAGTRRLSEMLARQSIPHRCDVWGEGAGHDWPYWRKMIREYI
jgi:esterase/lipase superfamily enzyme